ncbi:MAG: glycogen debranching enzyme [Gammaproteobacteria bacterium]|nr:glycogen debranching enzyme [Gammaproteobacteria bacterium]
MNDLCQHEVVSSERNFNEYLSEVTETAGVQRGTPLPLGVYAYDGGVNFALFSRHATRVRLELFTSASDSTPGRIIDLDPVRNRTGDVWHAWIKGIATGQLYDYRVDVPYEPGKGNRFNLRKLLLDPCATALARAPSWDFAAARSDESADSDARTSNIDDAKAMPKCVVTGERFDWHDDRPPRHPWSKTVIYETHVRGFTRDVSSGVRCPGTYRGLTEKIPYLKELGVTAVELLPVQEFNPNTLSRRDLQSGRPLRNYWGYDPVAFFAVSGAYSSAAEAGQQTLEFKEMVRRLHAAGIEVIIDIVLDHTAEADEHGATLCWPAVRDLILSALRYWVTDMHVDGFRFDLTCLLGRDATGKVLHNLPLLEQIAEDPILRDAKLVAAAWDVAGAYQVGGFSERRWAEWNGCYRDDVRRFWRGDDGMLCAFASRICGSADLYAKSGKGPECSINFVTCHDGFTLNDLVSFQSKHNVANGEDNRDGANENFSANYGVEGSSDDPRVESVRQRQIKNFLLTLFISRGVPMLLGGDEFRRTQLGNNNAYCQDNETSWYDWSRLRRYPDIHRFVRRVAALRRAYPVLARERFYTPAEISWFAATLKTPDWSDPRAKALGCLIRGAGRDALYLMFNAHDKPVSFTIPAAPDRGRWQLAIDTSQELPTMSDSISGSCVDRTRPYVLEPHSSAVLIACGSVAGAGDSPIAPAAVATGGCDSLIDHCATSIGGEDPSTAYAAAMLWYQGYPGPPPGGG